jgi:hypothetical protein
MLSVCNITDDNSDITRLRELIDANLHFCKIYHIMHRAVQPWGVQFLITFNNKLPLASKTVHHKTAHSAHTNVDSDHWLKAG